MYMYVSSICAKAKTRVNGSLGRYWARLVIMGGIVPFDIQDEFIIWSCWHDKGIPDMHDGINELTASKFDLLNLDTPRFR